METNKSFAVFMQKLNKYLLEPPKLTLKRLFNDIIHAFKYALDLGWATLLASRAILETS